MREISPAEWLDGLGACVEALAALPSEVANRRDLEDRVRSAFHCVALKCKTQTDRTLAFGSTERFRGGPERHHSGNLKKYDPTN